MKVELIKEWCMNMAKNEARAAELHESCRMPMEQARALTASEASPDWYARGTNCYLEGVKVGKERARAAYPFRERRGVIGQSGMSMLDLRFIVEQAHYERGGVKWLRQGDPYEIHELANQAADKLRAQGFRVRVRPIVV